MTNSEFGHSLEQEQTALVITNKEVLEQLREQGELGELLAAVYELALAEYPELANVDIKISDPTELPVLQKTGGAALHQSIIGTGKPLVVLNMESGVKHFEFLMKARQVSAQISAEKVGIDPQALTPKILAAFIWLHELGHGYDFLVNVPDPEKYRSRRDTELASLPFPGWNPARLANALEEGGELYEWYVNNMDGLRQAGYPSTESIIEAQERAYHSISSEEFPDKFAAEILKKHYQQLFGSVKETG